MNASPPDPRSAFSATAPTASRNGLTSDQVRELDRRAWQEYGLPGLVLMENAGRGCAERLMELGISGRVLIVCGSGNNGGDGLVIARHLDNHGHPVQVVLVGSPEKFTNDTAVQWKAVTRAGLSVAQPTIAEAQSPEYWRRQLQDVTLIVDAILGIGSTGEPRPPLPLVLTILNAAAARRVAIDLPTGLNADTGIPATTTFRADHTLTLVALKAGFTNPLAAEVLGVVEAIPIGVPRRLLHEFLDISPPTLG